MRSLAGAGVFGLVPQPLHLANAFPREQDGLDVTSGYLMGRDRLGSANHWDLPGRNAAAEGMARILRLLGAAMPESVQ